MPAPVVPSSFEDAARALSEAAAARSAVRILGGGTKPWGNLSREDAVEIRTTGLDRILEHNEGDLTAVLEAGVPLARAQPLFASAGQMLPLDPYLGPGHEATVGGILATGDSGPLRHRYGLPRDLILGMTVALSDGTIARSGGKVIKNVAGYDVGKLFCGSFGTLGMILSVSLRLHPLPAHSVTVAGSSDDPETISRVARGLAAAPLELEALDVAWRAGRGGILARCAGVATEARAQRVSALMHAAGVEQIEATDADAELWARQRTGQRAPQRALVRVAARPSTWAHVLRAADAASGTLVGRGAFGLAFIDLDPQAVGTLYSELPPGARAVLLDAPAGLREASDPWGQPPQLPVLDLMQRIKARFDPAHALNPGVFVGGI